MSSFFTQPVSQRKRKRTTEKPEQPAKRRDVQNRSTKSTHAKQKDTDVAPEKRDESLSGSETEEEEAPAESDIESEATSQGDDTAAERRARLAERYLDNIREAPDETGFDAEEIDKELISARLKESVDQNRASKYRLIASRLGFSAASHCLFRADTDATSAIAVQPPYVYTVSKDKTLIKWELVAPKQRHHQKPTQSRPPHSPRKRPRQIAFVRSNKGNKKTPPMHSHTTPIISLAVSPCGTYLATGSSTDRRLIIWSATNLTPLRTFTTHRDSVTALAFPPQSSSEAGAGAQLFSASADRTIKTYSLNGADSLAYVETLFGHQDHVLGIAAMDFDHCVSVGARDRTARYWKVIEETQSVFRADSSRQAEYVTGSVDCIAALPPAHFVTGSDSGAIQLWTVHKKKPLYTVEKAHGVEDPEPLETVSSEVGVEVLERLRQADTRRSTARGITALASVPSTDIVISGSWDGWVRVWKVSDDKRSLIPYGAVGQPAALAANQLSNGFETRGTDIPNGLHVIENEKEEENQAAAGPIRGIINSLAVFERKDDMTQKQENNHRKDGEGDTVGLCIVAATGKESRLGRWRKFPKGRNGAVVIEVPMRDETTNGIEVAG